MDIKPGRVVEFEGHLYLVEAVRLEVVLQKIESLRPLIERQEERFKKGDYNTPETNTPVWMTVCGDMMDEHFQHPTMRVLFPEGEAE